jgi:hypothetical protein
MFYNDANKGTREKMAEIVKKRHYAVFLSKTYLIRIPAVPE